MKIYIYYPINAVYKAEEGFEYNIEKAKVYKSFEEAKKFIGNANRYIKQAEMPLCVIVLK